MDKKPNKFEWAILVVFILLVVVIFFYRVNTPATAINQLTTTLLSSFEILFSLYVGYFLQRLDSTKQSRENLKKYGFLAYRRIMDIKKSIDRLFREIDKLSKNSPKEKWNDANILRPILEGTFDTVESSVLDWIDIIGDEISKKEKAEKLQQELTFSESQSNLTDKDKKKFEEIRLELDKLRSEIPSALRSNYLREVVDDEKTRFYTSYFLNDMRKDGFVELSVACGGPINPHEEEEILTGGPYLLRTSFRLSTPIIYVYDRNKNRIGEIINPINYDDGKYYILAFDKVFDIARLEDSSGFFSPSKCESAGFDNIGALRIIYASEVFPGTLG